MSLIFDLETTGIPKYRNVAPFKSYNYDKARIVEIAYIILSNDNTVIKEVKHLVKYDKVSINIENSFVHGITNDMIIEDGIDIQDMFDQLKEDLKQVNTIVAHNIDFDYNILLSEVYRHYSSNRELLGQLYTKTLYCTMLSGKQLMKVKKYPKLVELNKFLFDKDWNQTHRALDDVLVCKDCYIELKNKKF